jgi:hypothetical protein
MDLMSCPICDARIPKGTFAEHLRNVHPVQMWRPPSKSGHAASPKLARGPRNGARNPDGGTRVGVIEVQLPGRRGRRGEEAFEFPSLLETRAEGELGGRRKKRQKSAGRAETRPATHSGGIGKTNGGTQESDASQSNLTD